MPTPDRPVLRLSHLWHGADYYPEQWSEDVWAEDMDLMDEVRFTTVTLGVFAWAEIEPDEGEFHFDWLDKVFNLIKAKGRRIALATPSAAPPAWLAKAYPDILRAGPDRVRQLHGNRVNFCWSSQLYRDKVRTINEKLAERYGGEPALALWHVGNEYGGSCYCSECRKAFVLWLRGRFGDDLEELNRAYWSRFWSHRFTHWEQIEIPGPPRGDVSMPGLELDFRRFTTEQIIDFFRNEVLPIRRLSPGTPVTTNLMGFYDGIDPWKLAPELDVVSWDSYPYFGDAPIDARGWAKTGMTHDLTRSLGGGKPFLLMECSPSSSNWYPYMALKPPGGHLFEAMQAVGHGSDSVMYFQWRQGRGGQEQFHGAVIEAGQGRSSRVFRDVAEVGRVLEALSDVAGSRAPAEVALVYDWEAAWALDAASGPVQGSKGYFDTCLDFYVPLWEAGISVDVVNQDVDLGGYRLVLAPMLYLLKPGVVERLKAFVEQGGTLVASYLTAWVDERGLIPENGPFAALSELFGIRFEELDALYPGRHPRIVLPRGIMAGLEGSYEVKDFAEQVQSIDAEVLGVYAKTWYEGRPAMTKKRHGDGAAYYLGARLGADFNGPFFEALTTSLKIRRNYPMTVPTGVSVQRRVDGDDEFLFLLNSSETTLHLSPPEHRYVEALSGRLVEHGISLPAYGVAVLRKA